MEIKKISINRTFMELKQVGDTTANNFRGCINRTFMELKRWRRSFQRQTKRVLIEPLWN